MLHLTIKLKWVKKFCVIVFPWKSVWIAFFQKSSSTAPSFSRCSQCRGALNFICVQCCSTCLNRICSCVAIKVSFYLYIKWLNKLYNIWTSCHLYGRSSLSWLYERTIGITLCCGLFKVTLTIRGFVNIALLCCLP